MSTVTFERVQLSNKAKAKKFAPGHITTSTSCDRIDVDSLEKASREGLKKAIKDGTTPGWVRAI